jgi:hypothetical protein
VLAAGWLRANDRLMTVTLALRDLVPDARRRWLGALRGAGYVRLEVALRYEDGSPTEPGRTVERVRLVKSHASIRSAADVAYLWSNSLTLEGRGGVWRILEDPTATPAVEFFQAIARPDVLSVALKMGTNITSRQHAGRAFRWVARVWCDDDAPLTARSAGFELVAKPPPLPAPPAPPPPVALPVALPVAPPAPPVAPPAAPRLPTRRPADRGRVRELIWRPSWVPTVRRPAKRPRPSILGAPRDDDEPFVLPQFLPQLIDDFFV